jgi:hypothetical protein
VTRPFGDRALKEWDEKWEFFRGTWPSAIIIVREESPREPINRVENV